MAREAMEGREGRTFQYGLARKKGKRSGGEVGGGTVLCNVTASWTVGIL
jgi:hypothetical protein